MKLDRREQTNEIIGLVKINNGHPIILQFDFKYEFKNILPELKIISLIF